MSSVGWRLPYSARRYMRDISPEELDARYLQVLKNFLVCTDHPLLRPVPPSGEGERWHALHSHLLSEFQLRQRELPVRSDAELFALLNHHSLATNQARSLALSARLDGRPRLFKFGQRKYLKPMLDEGRIRVAGAAFYADPSLSSAIQDSELEVTREAMREDAEVLFDDNGIQRSIRAVGNLRFTTTFATDYYVYCLGTRYNPALFADFEADSCLVIHDPSTFRNLLLKVVGERLTTEWLVDELLVNYMDPLTDVHEPIVPLTKHFRYAYQHEYRFVWAPPTQTRALEPMFVSLGSLTSVAELVTLA
jgi:hypothetical protein